MANFSLMELDNHCADFNQSQIIDGNIQNEYLYFSQFWQHAFIKSDYIIDTGNFRNCNRELLYLFEGKIAEHPFLWKLFRKIFAV